MAGGPVTKVLRRHLRHPRIYSYARRAMLLGQYVARIPDEADLAGFGALRGRGKGLVVDVGANGGQSAIALAFLLPGFDIMSVEPNPALWRDLDFVARVIGRRFGYLKLGLGAGAGSMTLFVPHVGRLPITTRASLDREAAAEHCRSLEREIGRAPGIEETTVEVASFDALGLHPDAVKIDVEGFELQVLRGMTATLRDDRPVLMLESNAGDRACMALLEGMDYQVLRYERATRRMVDAPRASRNWFAIPAEHVAEFRA